MSRFYGVMASLVLLFVVPLFLLGVLVVDVRPIVRDLAAPTSHDVIEAKAFAQASRQAMVPLVTTAEQLNSVIRLISRFTPGLRSQFTVGQMGVEGKASIPVPLTGKLLWLNVSAIVPSFDHTLALSRFELGRLSLPPSLALEAGRRGANLIVSEGFGDKLIGVASSMTIEQDQLIFDLNINGLGGKSVMRDLFGKLRGAELPSPKDVDLYYVMIREAMDRGLLPSEGSFLPYLLFTLEAALEGSRIQGGPKAYTAALIALTQACGAKDFALVVGDRLGGDLVTDPNWEKDCSALTLNGRIDSRRHFTTAAALQAASNRDVSFTVGELKELYDIVKSGGFDFTDIAANNAGIRMSDRFMSLSTREWPTLLMQIEREEDIIISFDDIPQIMLEDEFLASIGTIESPQYQKELNRIEAKIDQLSLHRQ